MPRCQAVAAHSHLLPEFLALPSAMHRGKEASRTATAQKGDALSEVADSQV